MGIIVADLLLRTLYGGDRGEVVPVPQSHENASYAPLIRKEDGRIEWQDKAENICNRIRGFDPWPGAFTFYNNKKWGIWKAEVMEESFRSSALGEIVEPGLEGIVVKTAAMA